MIYQYIEVLKCCFNSSPAETETRRREERKGRLFMGADMGIMSTVVASNKNVAPRPLRLEWRIKAGPDSLYSASPTQARLLSSSDWWNLETTTFSLWQPARNMSKSFVKCLETVTRANVSSPIIVLFNSEAIHSHCIAFKVWISNNKNKNKRKAQMHLTHTPPCWRIWFQAGVEWTGDHQHHLPQWMWGQEADVTGSGGFPRLHTSLPIGTLVYLCTICVPFLFWCYTGLLLLCHSYTSVLVSVHVRDLMPLPSGSFYFL